MARPTDKESLLSLSKLNFDKLLDFIAAIPDDMKEKEFKLNERDKTISDVICHLHEWHLMMLRWYAEGMDGKKPVMPGEGYTWKTLPAYNRTVWEKYKGTKLNDALAMFKESHNAVMKLIEKHTDEELFTKKKYSWTGSTSLGSYFVSSASSHYDWGLKTLKPIKKS